VTTETRRPTFHECVKAVRRVSGDKRTYQETRETDGMTFQFSEHEQYMRALEAVFHLNPHDFEQVMYFEPRHQVSIAWLTCAHCSQPRKDHAPPGGQCLFASTRYKERTDG